MNESTQSAIQEHNIYNDRSHLNTFKTNYVFIIIVMMIDMF